MSLASQRFGCLMSPPILSTLTFHLVLSFGRSALRLNEESVGLILQACLGGNPKDFNVYHLSGWMYSFSVSCKNVGLMVYNLIAKPSPSSSSFGVEEAPIGVRNMICGVWSKKLSGQSWVLNPKQKRAMLKLFALLRLRKKSVLLRLKYPKNYYTSFFKDLPWPTSLAARSPISASSDLRNSRLEQSQPRRVLRWVPKGMSLKSTSISVGSPSFNSNSKASPATFGPKPRVGPSRPFP